MNLRPKESVEEQKKAARNRLASMEAARRVQAHNKQQREDKAKAERIKRVQSEEKHKDNYKLVYQPHEEPAYFDVNVERRHAEHLGKKVLDEESKMQVVYRILKDQLRVAKRRLLFLKRQNAVESRKAYVLAKKMDKQAAINATQSVADRKRDGSIADKVREYEREDGHRGFEFVGSKKGMSTKLKAIVKHLLTSDNRKHNKYCPCCRRYEEGDDPTAEQMGEFLDFIRQQHIKLHGKKANLLKRVKTREERLENDSVSNITDLSKEDIFTTSMEFLSKKEQDKLDEYNRVFRKTVERSAPKHDCLGMLPKEKQTKLSNARYMVTMELRAKSEPKEFSEKSVSAHQYSPRDISVQADSDEREENATMMNAIDLKTKMQNKINIYDLSVPKNQTAAKPNSQGLLKETKEIGVVTEFHRRLYCTQDWFYSVLYREMLTAFYAKTGDEVPE